MKTTVNIGDSKRIVTRPMKTGAGIMLEIEGRDLFTNEWTPGASFVIDEAAAGALIFGMEQAFEVMGMAPGAYALGMVPA